MTHAPARNWYSAAVSYGDIEGGDVKQTVEGTADVTAAWLHAVADHISNPGGRPKHLAQTATDVPSLPLTEVDSDGDKVHIGSRNGEGVTISSPNSVYLNREQSRWVAMAILAEVGHG